jgi:DNA mismatch repair protein MutL
VVYVDLPLHLVDVNVHPQKAEVRFADGRALFEAVTRELHSALAHAFSIPALGPTRGWNTIRSSKAADLTGAPPTGPYRADGTGLSNFVSPMSTVDPSNDSLSERTYVPPSDAALFEGTRFYGSLELLGQARSTFLVCCGNDGLYVLDQHAAAERVTFHRLRKAFVARAMATQRLLIPEVVELQPSDVAILEEHGSEIAALGVELRATGPSAVAVHAVPALLARPRPERIARDLVAELGGALMRPFGEAVDRVLATMACHGSVRAGDTLSREEASALLRALDEVDFAGHCPHGRPVVTRIGYDELERRVGR